MILCIAQDKNLKKTSLSETKKEPKIGYNAMIAKNEHI